MRPLGLAAAGQRPHRETGLDGGFQHRLSDEAGSAGERDDGTVDERAAVHFSTIWSRWTTEERGL